MALQANSEGRQLGGARAQAVVGGDVEPAAEVVESLSATADEGLQTVLGPGDGESGEALSRQRELVVDGSADARAERLDALLDAVRGGGDEFGGGGGRRGAQIGDEVRDGEVGLVSDGGDDRQL